MVELLISFNPGHQEASTGNLPRFPEPAPARVVSCFQWPWANGGHFSRSILPTVPAVNAIPKSFEVSLTKPQQSSMVHQFEEIWSGMVILPKIVKREPFSCVYMYFIMFKHLPGMIPTKLLNKYICTVRTMSTNWCLRGHYQCSDFMFKHASSSNCQGTDLPHTLCHIHDMAVHLREVLARVAPTSRPRPPSQVHHHLRHHCPRQQCEAQCK